MNRLSGFKQKASVVFYLVDDFTGRAVKTARISADGRDMPFVNKRDGFYVLANLPPSQYRFAIEAPDYLPLEKEMTVSGEGPVVLTASMQHDVNSKLLEQVTRIKGLVLDKSEQPLQNSQAQVTVISSSPFGRLMEGAGQGGKEIQLYSKEASLLEGKRFLLNGPKVQEWIKIARSDPGQGICSLEDELQKEHSSGTPIYPLWELKTSAGGEFILPLPVGFTEEETAVEVRVWQGKKTGSEKVDLQKGRVNPVTITL